MCGKRTFRDSSGCSTTRTYHLSDYAQTVLIGACRKYSIYDANAEEWISILKLSHEWNFPEVKRLATRYLETFTLDPVRKIELYQWYELDPRLLIPALTALINRVEPITLEEGQRLTLPTALRIATARECARGRLEGGLHSPVAASVKPDAVVDIIKHVFTLADVTPASPCLEPIAEGRGPSAFTATPLSPSKINTAPPPRQNAMSPTPSSKANGNAEPQPLTANSASKAAVPTPPSKQPTTSPVIQAPSTPAQPPASSGKPTVPDVPPYLQTSFSTSSTTGVSSTPLKSANSTGPTHVASLFTDPGTPNGAPPAASGPNVDPTKTGQSSVVRPSLFLPDTVYSFSLLVQADPTVASKVESLTTKGQETPKPSRRIPKTPSSQTMTSQTRAPEPQPAKEEKASLASGPTKPPTRSKVETKGATGKGPNGSDEDGGSTTEPASSGYRSDITNSADDAGIVGTHEHDEFSTNTPSVPTNPESAAKTTAETHASAGECAALLRPAAAWTDEPPFAAAPAPSAAEATADGAAQAPAEHADPADMSDAETHSEASWATVRTTHSESSWATATQADPADGEPEAEAEPTPALDVHTPRAASELGGGSDRADGASAADALAAPPSRGVEAVEGESAGKVGDVAEAVKAALKTDLVDLGGEAKPEDAESDSWELDDEATEVQGGAADTQDLLGDAVLVSPTDATPEAKNGAPGATDASTGDASKGAKADTAKVDAASKDTTTASLIDLQDDTPDNGAPPPSSPSPPQKDPKSESPKTAPSKPEPPKTTPPKTEAPAAGPANGSSTPPSDATKPPPPAQPAPSAAAKPAATPTAEPEKKPASERTPPTPVGAQASAPPAANAQAGASEARSAGTPPPPAPWGKSPATSAQVPPPAAAGAARGPAWSPAAASAPVQSPGPATAEAASPASSPAEQKLEKSSSSAAINNKMQGLLNKLKSPAVASPRTSGEAERPTTPVAKNSPAESKPPADAAKVAAPPAPAADPKRTEQPKVESAEPGAAAAAGGAPPARTEGDATKDAEKTAESTASKPALHVETGDAPGETKDAKKAKDTGEAQDAVAKTEGATGAPGAAADDDDDRPLASSVPKHLQGDNGGESTETETGGSRPESPAGGLSKSQKKKLKSKAAKAAAAAKGA